MKPVRILGAGPAGLAAAIALARAGRAVEVHERRPHVGARFVGDLHGVENWTEREDFGASLARFGIERRFDCDPVHDLVLTDGRRLERLAFPTPLFHLVRRGPGPGCLDRGLFEQAADAGARILFESTRPEAEVDLVATGPPASGTFVIEKGLLFRTAADDLAAALVSERAAVRGYGYLLIRRGVGCLCSVLFDRFDEAVRCLEETRRTFARLFVFDVRDPRPIGGVGAIAPRALADGSVPPRIGEAGGLQDFVWGFGIRSAITSGHLAARCLLEAEDYASRARAAFAGRMQAAVVSRWLWEALANPAFGPLVWSLRRSRDPVRWLRFAHRPNPIFRALHPISRERLRRRYPNLRW